MPLEVVKNSFCRKWAMVFRKGCTKNISFALKKKNVISWNKRRQYQYKDSRANFQDENIFRRTMSGAGWGCYIDTYPSTTKGICTIQALIHFKSHFKGSLDHYKGGRKGRNDVTVQAKRESWVGAIRGRRAPYKPMPFKSQGRVAWVVWGLWQQGNWALKQSLSSLLKRKHTTGLMPACAKVSHTEAVR